MKGKQIMNNNLNNRSIVLLKSCCILNYVKVKSPEYHAHLRYKNFYKDTWVRICEFLQTNKKYILGNNSKKVKKGQKRVVKSKKVRYNWKRWLKERRSTKQEKVLMRKKVKKSKKGIDLLEQIWYIISALQQKRKWSLKTEQKSIH